MNFFAIILLLSAVPTLIVQAASCYCNYDFNYRGYGCVTDNVVFLKQTEIFKIDGEHFPLDDDSTVMHFTIENSQVRFVPPEILAKYENLKYLALNKVGLSDITEKSFINCGPLRELHLEYNDLTVLRTGVFSQCANLVYLYLNNNKISTIRKDAFAGLTKLVSLHFYANFYSTFPTETFSPLTTLSYLSIGSGNLSSIHQKTFVNNQLGTLTIKDSNLTSIHRDLFKGQIKLSEVNIMKSLIESFEPGTLQNIASLANFMMSTSRLTKIDAAMFAGLKNLRYISVNFNRIESFHPDAFVDNVNLEFFYVDENRLQVLNGTTLRNNPKIKYMALGGNRISAIERNFFDSFGNSLLQVSAYRNVCIDKNLQQFTNFTTQVQPYFRNCYKKYDELFPSAA